jgi:hypothetical protein
MSEQDMDVDPESILEPEEKKTIKERLEAVKKERARKPRVPSQKQKVPLAVRSNVPQAPLEPQVYGSDDAVRSVPTTLEGLFAIEGELKSSHQVLAVLVEADIKEADAILGRTRVSAQDVVTINNALDIARQGMGGRFKRPIPFVSKWVLGILRTLPSVGGKSREEFTRAWSSSDQRRRELQEQQRKRQDLIG